MGFIELIEFFGLINRKKGGNARKAFGFIEFIGFIELIGFIEFIELLGLFTDYCSPLTDY